MSVSGLLLQGLFAHTSHRSGGGPRQLLTTLAAAQQTLNQAQKDAVLAPLNSAALCIAGPGSGKTKVLTTRIAHLVKNKRAAPSSILAITFTNKAAKEMKTRLAGILGPDEAQRVTIGTFHSFSSRLLRQAGQDYLRQASGGASSALDKDFVIWDQSDSLKTVKELMTAAEISDTIKAQSVLSAVNNIREARCMALTFAASNGEYADALSKNNRVNRAAFVIVDDYEKKLRAGNAADFQDLLLLAHNLLKIPEFLSQVNSRYKHVLVDEYQDTNVPQYEIVRLLAPPQLLSSDGDEQAARSFFAVGDPNQAVYGWRGARVGNMDQLSVDYPGIQRYGLLENYRCSPAVTTVANAIMATTATKPREGSAEKRFEPVRVISCVDDAEQAQCVSTLLLTLRGKAGAGNDKKKNREVAVMYRTNAQSRMIEQELVKAGIKHVLLGGRRFYDRKEVKDALSFLRLVQNPSDRLSCSRCMEEFGTGIGTKTVEAFFSWIDASAAAAEASGGNSPPPTVLDHLEALVLQGGGILPAGTPKSKRGGGDPEDRSAGLAEPPQELNKRAEKALLAFAEQILELRALAHTSASVSDLGLKITQMFVTPQYLLRISKTAAEAQDRQENVGELVKAMQKFSAAAAAAARPAEGEGEGEGEGGCVPTGKLAQFLEEAALLSADDNEAEAASASADGDVVYLLTIHASKGLEFDTVFLTGAEEGTLPIVRGPEDAYGTKPSEDSDEVAEERRLAFVAVTRAKTLLFITHRAQVLRFSSASGGAPGMRTETAKPSRFLAPLSGLDKTALVQLKWRSPSAK